MRKLRAYLTLVGLLVSVHVAQADLVVSLNPENRHLVLNGMGEEVSGLDFVSDIGNLIPGTSPSPFAFFLASTPNQVSAGSLGTNVTVDGAIELDTGWMGPFPGDLQAGFGYLGSLRVSGRANFGRVVRGDVSSATIDDAITIRRLRDEPTVELLSLETDESSIFEVVDFQPITLDDNQPEISFGVSADLTAQPGIYFGFATVETSEGPSVAPISFITIVPEPVGSLIAVIASTGVLLLRYRLTG